MTRRLWIALGLVAVACAARSPQPSAFHERDTKHGEILIYHQNIIEYRKELGLTDQPDPREVPFFHGKPIESPPPAPRADSPEQCLDVCDLAERICKAQEDICRIADELGEDDEWAQGKCDSAKASCREAKRRCTDCT